MPEKMILPKAHLRNWIYEIHPTPYSTQTKKDCFEAWATEGKRMSKLRPDHANIEVLVEDWEKLMLDIAEVGSNPKDYTRESGFEKVGRILADFQEKHNMAQTLNIKSVSTYPTYREERCSKNGCRYKICDC